MYKKNERSRHLHVFAFNRVSKTAKTAGDIFTVFGEDAITQRTAQKWNLILLAGAFDRTNSLHSG